MPSYNSCTLMGNVVKKPIYKELGDNGVVKFTVATNRKWKNSAGETSEEVAFIDAEAWGGLAKVIDQYAEAGKPIFVSGFLKQDNWEDKETGQKRSKLILKVEEMQLLGGAPQREESSGKQTKSSYSKPARSAY